MSKQPNQINDWGTFDHTKFDVDDHVTSYMTFANRASMQFECSWSANIKEDKVHVSLSGEDGGINLFPFEIYEPRFGTILKTKLMLSITKTLLVRDRRVTLSMRV